MNLLKRGVLLLVLVLSLTSVCAEGMTEEVAKEMQTQIISECSEDIDKCDCSSISDSEGKKQCELAIIEAKYQRETERNNKMKECMANLDACDCSQITEETGKAECETELMKGKELKIKMETACKENPVACDCSTIASEEGKSECNAKKNNALSEIDNQIKAALSKCFKDVDKCDCNNLGLNKKEYIDFCDIQKSYGLNCKYKVRDCEKLDEVEIYPAGMPPWLGTLFAKHYKTYIEDEKAKASKLAAGVVTGCINSPETCDCSQIPDYSKAFCEKQKQLQIKCYAEDYDACVVLEKSSNLPDEFPAFMVGPIDKLISKLRGVRADASKANAARKVGNMILDCMDDSSKCDCSMAPVGEFKTFCQHKKELVISCRDEKDYDSCFKLDEEPLMPENVPGIIKNYIEDSIAPKVEEKKQVMFDEMKKGTSCAEIKTIQECKAFLDK